MVPSEYRLEKVASRIADRLEASRRSYEGEPDRAAAAFREVAAAMVEDVIAELRLDGFTDDPDRHAGFLRREVLETFLPRYTRLATRQTESEARGFGLGVLQGPVGRVVLFLGILLVAALMMRAAGPFYLKFSLLVPLIGTVFLPDVVAAVGRVRHRRALDEALEDMRLLQERALDYTPPPATLPLVTPPEA
jgi:hypothetical protein